MNAAAGATERAGANMDRRHFLATGALATASTLLPASAAVAATEQEALFQYVNFYSDGLALTPREYAVLLDQATKRAGFTPDNYSRGGAVEALEAKFAARLGKEAAIFLPTGTLANQLAVRKLAGEHRRVLVQAESHLYNDSGDGAQALANGAQASFVQRCQREAQTPPQAGSEVISYRQVDDWFGASSKDVQRPGRCFIGAPPWYVGH